MRVKKVCAWRKNFRYNKLIPSQFLCTDCHSAFRDSFIRLSEDNKTQVFCDLLDLCAPDRKLQVVKAMKVHLSCNFILLLPPELLLHLLSFLSVEDLVSSLQVSRGWRERISEADPIWEAAARKMGLDDFVVSTKLPKYNDTMLLVVLAAVKHRKSISFSTPQIAPQSLVPPFHGPFSGWRYAGNGVVYDEGMKAMARIRSPCKVFPITAPQTTRSRPIVPSWAAADRDQRYLTWRGAEHDSWTRYRFGLQSKERWVEAQDLSSHVADVCDFCGLITTFPSEIADGQSRITMTVRKLLPRHRQPLKSYCQLEIPACSANLKRDSVLTITEAETFCQGSPVASSDEFCSTHHVLLKFECKSVGAAELCTLAEYCFPTALPFTLKPKQTLQLQGGDTLSFFQVSSDGRLASIMDQLNNRHHVWKLGDLSGHSIVPVPPDTSCCLALGHLYSVLQCADSVKVVTTYTGELLLNCPFQPSPNQRFWEPVDSRWLNDLDFYEETDWHIVVTVSRQTLSSIVATRRHATQVP